MLNTSLHKNYPANLLEEAQTAAQLSGIVSHETQLSFISAVEDTNAEMERIKRKMRMIW